MAAAVAGRVVPSSLAFFAVVLISVFCLAVIGAVVRVVFCFLLIVVGAVAGASGSVPRWWGSASVPVGFVVGWGSASASVPGGAVAVW